jgi:hypothetical protein
MPIRQFGAPWGYFKRINRPRLVRKFIREKKHHKETINEHVRLCQDGQESFQPLKPGKVF